MVVKKKVKKEPYDYQAFPELGRSIEEMPLGTLVAAIYNISPTRMTCTFEAVISKLITSEAVHVEGFGTFCIFHTVEQFKKKHRISYPSVAFTPDKSLLDRLASIYVKF
jgi:hypothetical protein